MLPGTTPRNCFLSDKVPDQRTHVTECSYERSSQYPGQTINHSAPNPAHHPCTSHAKSHMSIFTDSVLSVS